MTRDGVRLYWERYGDGERTVLLLPTWSIVHSRAWKLQIPYLARHFRVLTFDGRGNGRSDRPAGAEAYATSEFAADALAVMDATGTASAALVALSCGALWATIMAATSPERVERIAYIGPAVPLAPDHVVRAIYSFDDELDTDAGWAKYNRHYWLRDYEDFVEFFAAQCLNEPHSTKQIEDFIGWALATDPATLVDTIYGLKLGGTERWIALLPRVRCPTLVLHGDEDKVRPHAQGAALAEATGGELVTLAGSGHLPETRDPVRVNLLLREFLGRAAKAARTFVRAPARQTPSRALHLLADRAWARAAGPRDRARAAAAVPRSGDRLARPAPGHGGAGRCRRAHPPGERAAGERVGAHQLRERRPPAALLPGDPAHG